MVAQYTIGIDLGTTNCVLAYTPLDAERPQVEILPVPQVVAKGTVESPRSLPSFLYLAPEHEAAGGALDVLSQLGADYAVGRLARSQAAEVPDRTVTAAKSWLVNHRVDRHQTILPWNAPDEVPKVSPVTACRRYLEHLARAWESAFPEAPLSEQQVVVTVPASFDASARELTREAALEAGLPERFLLLEEPQAAVYAWLATLPDRWRRQLTLGDTLLVCDVGGGTTDLTLVGVSDQDGQLTLERIAVGRHLLVGGDNMDVALAHYAAGLFADKGIKLDPWQSVSLWHSCRMAKETLLADNGPPRHPLSVLGRGSRLIGGTVSVEVEADKVQQMLIDGFFPPCGPEERPARQRVSGFQEIGLPFESDTAVTRHLAAFLHDHGQPRGLPVRPSHVLLNGGVFKSSAIRRRLLEVLGGWSGGEVEPRPLEGPEDLDFAVARGAAYYGWSKLHGGVRIRGGTARSYYVGIESSGLAVPGAPRPLHALCVVPIGMEEGAEADVPGREIGLVVGEPARFRFFSSAVRKNDQPGDLLTAWTEEELQETDPLEAELSTEAETDEPYVPVRFHSCITELGMFELWCVGVRTDERWKLEFNVREEVEA
jgi:hypothetical protein